MKLDRLIGILTVLLQNKKTTAPQPAKHFGVSRRTVLRDIDTLNMAGIPIVATRGGDGGITIMDGYEISHGVLTTDELQNLTAALKGLDSVSKQSNYEENSHKETQLFLWQTAPYCIEFHWKDWYVFGADAMRGKTSGVLS